MFNNDDDRKTLPNVYFKAILRGLIISIVLLIIISIVFYFSDLTDAFLQNMVWFAVIISICYAAIYGALNLGKKGFIHGAVIGFVYMLMVMTIAFLSEGGRIKLLPTVVMLVTSIVIGALSGMIGMVISNNH